MADQSAEIGAAPLQSAVARFRVTLKRVLSAVSSRGRLAALTAFGLLLLVRMLDPAPLTALRFQAFDFFQQIEPRELKSGRLVIVDIDEESIARLGQWPWSRAELARLVEALDEAGAAAIGFDIVFSEPDRLSPRAFAEQTSGLPDMMRGALSTLPDTDAVFAKAVRAAPVVLGVSARETAAAATDRADPINIPHLSYRGDVKPFLFVYPSMLRNLDSLEEAAPGRGFFSLTPEHDGVVRRIPMVLRVGERVYPSLSLEMLRLDRGVGHFATLLDARQTGLQSVGVGPITVPTDVHGRAWVPFSEHVPDLYVSAADVIDGSIDQAAINGKLVLVGTSAIGLRDLRLTPLGQTIPGVEIHAQMLDAALSGEFLQRPGYATNLEHLVAAIGALLLIGTAGSLTAKRGLPLILALLGAVWIGAFLIFKNSAIALDPTYPSLAILLVFAVLAYANYSRAEAQRRQIRAAFSHYLSPDLVARLADEPDSLSLGGETREMTFLFCDIAGFTSFVEKAEPAALVRLLNEYLDGVCKIVMSHGGTIDKIVGDAVHAMFNAPLDDPRHAENAVQCALAIEAYVADFRRRKACEGVDFGATRIGVNTGPAVVGNFGGAHRFDYTAHGDAINTAARLESVNKHLGTTICVSETTRRLCPEIEFRPIGRLALAGKNKVVTTFEPTRAQDDRTAPMAEYVAAYDLLAACAADVREVFDRLVAAYPNDPLIALHSRRLANGEHSADIVMATK